MKATHCKDSRFKIQDSRLRNYKICNLKSEICYGSRFTVHGSRHNGFTLLEIMIALAIVGAVVIAILHTVNYHADVAYEQTITTTMLLIAKEKIAEMELKPENAEGTISGTNFTYENSVKTTEDEETIELKTIIRGYGKKSVLSKLVLNKQIQKSK